jgi:3-oxoadipate enol-lactonase
MSKTRVRGIELAYDDVGSGPAVVLLHGYPFDRSMWQDQVAALREHHRVIAPDLRGLGETAPQPGPTTMEELARDVAALMEISSVSRATLCGLSMGGYVALAFCRIFPLRVRGLVLADTRAKADTEEVKKNREQQAEKALKQGMSVIVDALLPKLLAPETFEGRPKIVRRLREMMMNTKPEGAASALRGMALRNDQTTLLSRIISPTLITVGRQDKITPLADAEEMHRDIGGSRLEVIEGAGHVSNIEQPDQFNRVLLKFLHDMGH